MPQALLDILQEETSPEVLRCKLPNDSLKVSVLIYIGPSKSNKSMLPALIPS